MLNGSTTGSVTVQATTITQDNATANGQALGFAKTGVGASVALDIAGNGATAEASGTVTSPGQVNVIASGNYIENDMADAGATGGTALGAGAGAGGDQQRHDGAGRARRP